MKQFNRSLGMAASAANIVCVAGFAAFMLAGLPYASYLVSMMIALSFVPMICAYAAAAPSPLKGAGYAAMSFAAVYTVFILAVYFAQITAVRSGSLSESAAGLLDYTRFGLFFSYDLLGYGLMALSTFFAAFTFTPVSAADKWLKGLLLVHGILFFPTGIILPVLGLFGPGMQGADWIGILVLEFWCAYFLPVGILSFLRFKKQPRAL